MRIDQGATKRFSMDGRENVLPGGRDLRVDQSLMTREIIDNLNHSPVGRLLSMIGSLPEIRYEKVSSIRRQINSDSYELDVNLDRAIDMVIEELLTD